MRKKSGRSRKKPVLRHRVRKKRQAGQKHPARRKIPRHHSGSSRISAGTAGARAGQLTNGMPELSEKELKLHANQAWAKWWNRCSKWRSRKLHQRLAQVFIDRYGAASGKNLAGTVLLPTAKTAAAVVCFALPSSSAAVSILDQLGRLPLHEIIVVTDTRCNAIWEALRSHSSNPAIIRYNGELAPYAARAIGAKAAASEIVLFVDESQPVPAEIMARFITAIANGSDLALNDVTVQLSPFGNREPLTMVMEFFNAIHGYRQLGASSLISYPHALSRHAVEAIGAARLVIPAAAHSYALLKGMKIAAPAAVNINRARLTGISTAGEEEFVNKLVFGDCLEALHHRAASTGSRLGYLDNSRQRSLVKEAALCE